MKTNVNLCDHDVSIEEKDGNIVVTVTKDGEVVEDLTVECSEDEGEEGAEESEDGEDVQNFDDFEEEEDFEEGEEEESDEEVEEDETEDLEESVKLKDFNSFIK